MKLLDLHMLNFMPYGGEHKIVFPVDKKKNVMVVFADNMRGKTSLLNAIRWCFYGTALGRHSKALDLADMVNSDARKSDDYRLHVHLRFEEHGHQYDLRRSAELKELVVHPRGAQDYQTELSLQRDGTALRGDEIEHELNQLMPEQVSRFFLFDGELLQEYEALLADDQEQSKRIKEAIEQVLGVPALTRGRDELKTLLRLAQGVQAKENKHVEGLRAMAEQQLQIQASLESLAADIRKLEADEQGVLAEVEAYDEQLAATDAVQRVKVQLDETEQRLQGLKQQDEHLKTAVALGLKDAWKDLLQPRLAGRIADLELKRSRMQADVEQSGALKERIRQCQTSLLESACDVCGEPMSERRREEIGASLGRFQGELAALGGDVARVSAVNDEMAVLNRLRSSGAGQQVRADESSRNRTAIEITSAEGRLAELLAQVRGHDTAEIARVRALRDARQQALGRVKNEIGKQREVYQSFELRQNELSKVMSKNTAARAQRSNREVEIYGWLERTFSQGVEVLRTRLKQEVEERASNAFLSMTTDKTYRGLKINDGYGLSILDRDGRVVSIRSAGAEQIVALALIDGLNRTARKTGPIIMDTPLGRLDPKHRAAVLREVPNMAEQVILLVHEGEIDRTTGVEPFANRIGAAYEIEYVSSSQSRLKNLKGSRS